MEYIIIYILSVIISFFGEISNGFMLFKDVADAGYKINIEKMNDFLKQFNSNNKNSMVRMLIPVYNLYKVMEIRMNYVKQRVFVLDQLDVMDSLEEMTEEEKIEYSKKPSGLNAVLLSMKSALNQNEENVNLEEYKNMETPIIKTDAIGNENNLNKSKTEKIEDLKKLKDEFLAYEEKIDKYQKTKKK